MLRTFLIILTMLLGTTSAMAASLFNTEVVLDDTDTATEQAAKESAFVDVLIRASGQSTLGENPVIQKALPTVNQYITQLGYGGDNGQRTLLLGFDDKKIRTLLTQAEARFWGAPRPDILFWLIEDTASSRNVVWEQSGSPLIGELKQEGERRGLPILMPVGDFDDVIAVSVPDLWGGFAEPVANASARYNPAGVVVVKVRDNRISWQLFPNAADITGTAQIEGQAAGQPQQALAAMVDQISDFYAERLAVNLGATDSSSKALEITGLDDAEDFFVAERVLKSLNSVAAVRLEALEDGKATFRLSLLASEDIFHNEMLTDRRLRRVELTPVAVVETTPSAVSTEVVTDVIVTQPQPSVVQPEPSISYEWVG